MKHLLISLLICFVQFSLMAQTAVQWSDSMVVAATPLPVTAPRIVLLADGTPLCTWGTSGNPTQIWASRLENGVFSTPVSVVQGPVEPDLFGFGGFDVAVSGNKVFIVFEQLQVGIHLVASNDGGVTFTPPVLVQGPVSGGYATLASVVADGSGNPVVSYIHDKGGANYQVRRSADGGLTFGDPVIANAPAPGGAVCECCTSDMVASGDSLWMIFRNNNQNLRDIWVSRSTDQAASFDTAADVDSTDWILNACPISGPRMTKGGDSLLTVWMSRASGIGRVYLSTVHAATMETGQQLGFPFIPLPQNAQSQGDIAANGDTTGVVFVEKAKEIMFYYSTHGTANLTSQGTRFAVTNHTLQYPSLTYQNGRYHLLYVDATIDQVLYRSGTLAQSSSYYGPQQSPVTVFPNPSAGKITIRTSGRVIADVTITDVHGTQIPLPESRIKNDAVNLDITGCSPGVYFIHFKLDDTWRQEKILKFN